MSRIHASHFFDQPIGNQLSQLVTNFNEDVISKRRPATRSALIVDLWYLVLYNQSQDVRIFKSRWFQRFSRKEELGDAALIQAVARAEKGQVDANLGAGVIKQRIARPGLGKSRGYRTIIFFRRGSRAFFIYGFAKSERANIDQDEEKQFKEAAKHVLALTDKQLGDLLKRGDFIEVKTDG